MTPIKRAFIVRSNIGRGKLAGFHKWVLQPQYLIFFYYTTGRRLHKHVPIYAGVNRVAGVEHWSRLSMVPFEGC